MAEEENNKQEARPVPPMPEPIVTMIYDDGRDVSFITGFILGIVYFVLFLVAVFILGGQ